MNNTRPDAADSAEAWLLSLGAVHRAAVGIYEVVHVLPHAPALFQVPQAPVYCRGVILWEERVLPVVDLRSLASAGAARVDAAHVAGIEQLVAVVAYQTDPSQIAEYGALLLAAVPARITVTNQQGCEFDPALAPWASFSSSCFRHPNLGAVPVLDLRRVFRPTQARSHLLSSAHV
jgi:chemotaxis signal transduction protein